MGKVEVVITALISTLSVYPWPVQLVRDLAAGRAGWGSSQKERRNKKGARARPGREKKSSSVIS